MVSLLLETLVKFVWGSLKLQKDSRIIYGQKCKAAVICRGTLNVREKQPSTKYLYLQIWIFFSLTIWFNFIDSKLDTSSQIGDKYS